MKTMKRMNAIVLIASLLAGVLLPGCTATKIEYEQNNKGETKYSLWHNDHWMKTSTERLAGGMDKNGKFSVELAGRDSSPSEEFNRTMQTYTTAFIQLAQIAAAAYNPSASGAIQSAAAKSTSAESSGAASPQSSNQSTSAVSAPSAGENTTPTTNPTTTQSADQSTSAASAPSAGENTTDANVTATAESPATK